jgi:hypothetical protein
LKIRVYPPGRSAKRSASSPVNFFKAATPAVASVFGLCFFAFRPGVPREKKRRRLTGGMQRSFALAGLAGGSRPASQGDSFFGERTQFFRLRKRSDNSLVKHEGRAEVPEQRLPVRRCTPQLSVRNKVSHDFYSST